jgi:hypothetical protein
VARPGARGSVIAPEISRDTKLQFPDFRNATTGGRIALANTENGNSDLRVKVIHAAGCTECDVPAEITIGTLVSELVARLSLPRIESTDGKLLEYRLDSKSLGRRLLESETLASATICANDTLILTVSVLAGENVLQAYAKSPIHVVQSSIGLSLSELREIEARTLLSNEPALTMALHHHRDTLLKLATVREELATANHDVRRLADRLRDKNISTLLLLLGQILTGFGVSLITAKSVGGWLVFLAGLILSLGALSLPVLVKRRDRPESQKAKTEDDA